LTIQEKPSIIHADKNCLFLNTHTEKAVRINEDAMWKIDLAKKCDLKITFSFFKA